MGWLLLFGALTVGGTLAPPAVTTPFHQLVDRAARQWVPDQVRPAGRVDGAKSGWRSMSAGRRADKLGHLLVFFFFTLSASRLFNRAVAWRLALFLAVGTESLQSLTLSRSGRLFDVLIDLSGAVLGLGLGWLVWGAVQEEPKQPPRAE